MIQEVRTYTKQSDIEIRKEIEEMIRKGYRVVSMYGTTIDSKYAYPARAWVVYERFKLKIGGRN